MRLLAIDTSHSTGSVAALADGKLLAERELRPGQGTAQSLAPGLKEILAEIGWKPSEVQVIAVTVGPGSFTGLRVGMAAAKTFAYSVGAEIVGIDTLEAIAAAAPAEVQAISVAVDAQRGDVAAGMFARGPDGWFVPTGAEKLIEADAWLHGLPPGSCVAGPVLRKLVDRLPEHVTALDPQFWFPRAGTVAQLAARRFGAGQRDDVWRLLPHYYRRSAAEEKWEEKQREKQS
jgi:tRNA threonylcarbamoyladenosine biosynthesis protein TsaB